MRYEKLQSIRIDRDIAKRSPEDSVLRKHLNHQYGASFSQMLGFGDMIAGLINNSDKNILLGAFIYLVSMSIVEYRTKALHKAIQQSKE